MNCTAVWDGCSRSSRVDQAISAAASSSRADRVRQAHRKFKIVPARAIIAKWQESFVAFRPRVTARSFIISDAMEKIEEAGAGQRELSPNGLDRPSAAVREAIEVRALHSAESLYFFLGSKVRSGRSWTDDLYRELRLCVDLMRPPRGGRPLFARSGRLTLSGHSRSGKEVAVSRSRVKWPVSLYGKAREKRSASAPQRLPTER